MALYLRLHLLHPPRRTFLHVFSPGRNPRVFLRTQALRVMSAKSKLHR